MKQLRFDMGDVGRKLSIYQYRYDHWYPCTVVGFDRRRNLHCCQYDDGDKKWHDLKQKEFKMDAPAGGDDTGGRAAQMKVRSADSGGLVTRFAGNR